MLHIINITDEVSYMAGLLFNNGKEKEKEIEALKQQLQELEQKYTDLEETSRQAEEERKQALAADDAKGKFLAHMSHEIRTPINAVLGMNTMILRETKDMQIKEYALDIQTASQNLLSLINDILDFSKIESGKLEIISVEYDMSSMIHDVSNMIMAKARDKKLTFDIHLDENLPSKLFGDDVRIRQILVNLLNNGVKYTHQGSVSLSIGGRKQDGKILLDFEVADTGIGIKEEDISKLFQEFERIEEERNRNIEGTGLGMNITVQLLSLMNSSLQVESEYGKGSKFSFTIEQRIIDSTPIGNLEKRIREQTVDYSYMEVFTAPDAQILVVDDNATNLKVFVNLLKTTKVNVDVADGGKACLEMIKKKHYDLIFLDHMMPDLDGIETLHRMKEMSDSMCDGVPVIALTANAITGAKEMYLAEGFDAFLSKPINPEKLEQMILLLLPRDLLIFEVAEEGAGEENKAAAEVSNLKKWSTEISEDFLPTIEGIEWNYGLLHLKDAQLLKDTAIDFYRTIDTEADVLEKYFHDISQDENALNMYRIKVHAMKSSAALIGAAHLSGVAKLLEYAARDGALEIINSVTPVFLADWRRYKEKLAPCVPKEGKQSVTDVTVVIGLLEQLQWALEDMDIDASDAAIEQLRQYSFSDIVQGLIEELSTAVVNLDSENGIVLIGRIVEEIKGL